MKKNKIKTSGRVQRHKRVRAKISGTSSCPRFSVFRSNKYISAQLIDDVSEKTLVSVSDLLLFGGKKSKKGTKVDHAKEAGEELAKLAKAKKITKVVFDRGGYKYHGRVKSMAEGARKGGLIF